MSGGPQGTWTVLLLPVRELPVVTVALTAPVLDDGAGAGAEQPTV